MKNVEASIRARLTLKAKEHGITFQYASVLYMQEGLLARIAGSAYAKKLILKGGFLLFANQQAAGRTTKDIDFLGDGIPNDPQALAEILAVLVTREYGDGLSFDVGSIRSERITEAAEYHGVRLHVTARLGTARNTIQVDVGFGDALEGGPRSTILRKLLDDTPLVVTTCPLATVLAEKLESTIALGNVNSRMKDLYDLWFILEHVPLSDQEILVALRATFARRRTVMPDGPAVFSRKFVNSERTKLLWEGFTRRSKLGNLGLSSILDIIKMRLEPLYTKMRLMQD